tara:strand:- start:141 stop:344 length:204 start_codon:yes stop_codon:yes gene_type:complete
MESDNAYTCRTGFIRDPAGDIPVGEKERKEACSKARIEKFNWPLLLKGGIAVGLAWYVIPKFFKGKD